MTASLDSEAKVRITAQLTVSTQKSVNFEPAGYSLTIGRNRGASLGPTSSRGGATRGGRGWPAQCYLIPPPGGH
jgi:hypothetical protein